MSKPLKILLCSTQPPRAPLNGLRLVLAELLARLDRSRFETRVLALDGEVPMPRFGRAGLLTALPRAYLTGQPLRFAELADAMRPALDNELRTFDPDLVVVANGELASIALTRDRPHVLIALDALHVNVAAQEAAAGGLRRLLFRHERRRVEGFERTRYRLFENVVVVSERDRDALSRIGDGERVTVIPNGVDAERFRRDPGEAREKDLVVFHGTMDYDPNVTAALFLAREIFPRLRRQRPEARLAIVGRQPSAAVRRLAAEPGVEVLGEVDDMRSRLVAAGAYVCPMRTGTGIKNKLLEAMACGAPCVTTSLGLGGIAAEPGRSVLVADDADGLADLAARVLAEPSLGDALGREAREAVVRHHDWNAVVHAYEQVFLAASVSAEAPRPHPQNE